MKKMFSLLIVICLFFSIFCLPASAIGFSYSYPSGRVSGDFSSNSSRLSGNTVATNNDGSQVHVYLSLRWRRPDSRNIQEYEHTYRFDKGTCGAYADIVKPSSGYITGAFSQHTSYKYGFEKFITW